MSAPHNIKREQSASAASITFRRIIMQAMLIVYLLTVALAVAQESPSISVPPVPIKPVPVSESVVFSQDLDPEYTPCRLANN